MLSFKILVIIYIKYLSATNNVEKKTNYVGKKNGWELTLLLTHKWDIKEKNAWYLNVGVRNHMYQTNQS